MTAGAAPLPVLGTVREAYGFVSASLPVLFDLGRGPALVAFVLGLVFGLEQSHDVTPLAVMASVIGYAWFSFYVLRLALLGKVRARLPAPGRRAGEGPARRSGVLAGFMLRALGLAAAALGAFFLLTLVVVVPLTAPPPGLATAGRASVDVVGTLVVAAALFCLPIGVPLARLLPLLAAAALGGETTLGAAWRLSKGHGLRLAVTLILIAAPYVVGYAILDGTLQTLAAAEGGDPGLAASLLVLLLITAIGLTATALASYAIARAWSRMTGTPLAGPDVASGRLDRP